MLFFLTAVSASAVVCFLRLLWRGETFTAGLFLTLALVCGVWAGQLHVPGMRDWVPGPLMACGTMLFCMSCGRHNSFVWNWVLSPAGQAFGGLMAIAGFALSTICIAW